MPIFFWTRNAWLSLQGSWRSTVVLSSMLLVSVATLIFLSAIAVGVNDAMVRNSTSLYSGQVSASRIDDSMRGRLGRGPGVEAVLLRAHNPGIITRDKAAEPLVLIEVDPEMERTSTALWKKTVSGGYLDGDGKDIFISEATAQALSVGPGDAVVFSPAKGAPVEFAVKGVYRTGVASLDRGVAFSPAGSSGIMPEGLSAAIFLEDGVDPAEVARLYEIELDGADFKTWDELMPDLKQLIELNYVSMDIVMALVFGVVSLGIAGAFSIYILKGVREYGIMKAMGVGTGELVFLVVSKIALVNLFSSALGVALGAAVTALFSSRGIDLGAFTSHNQYFSVSGVIYPRLTGYSLLLPPAAAFLFGLAASIWPALIVARRKAAEILRTI